MSQKAQKSVVLIEQQTPKVDLHLTSQQVDKDDIAFTVLLIAFNVVTSISYFNMEPDERKYMMAPYIGTSAISVGAIIIYMTSQRKQTSL